MLKRRNKRRYLAIFHMQDKTSIELLNIIKHRYIELFGSLGMELTSIFLYNSNYNQVLIINCNLKYLNNILTSICMVQPPVTTISMSGTLKKLRNNIKEIIPRLC